DPRLRSAHRAEAGGRGIDGLRRGEPGEEEGPRRPHQARRGRARDPRVSSHRGRRRLHLEAPLPRHRRAREDPHRRPQVARRRGADADDGGVVDREGDAQAADDPGGGVEAKGEEMKLDEEAIERLVLGFEATTLSDAEWNHPAHLVVSLRYVKKLGARAALSRMRESLLRWAGSRGKLEAYHETITRAWIAVIGAFVAREDRGQPIGELAALLVASHTK